MKTLTQTFSEKIGSSMHYTLFLLLGIACFQVSNYISVQNAGGAGVATLKAIPFVVLGTYLYALYFSNGSETLSYLLLVVLATSGNILASVIVERFALPSGAYGLKEYLGMLFLGTGAAILIFR